ncbi:MAG: hypothetical protein K940chlam7_01647 [Chlamydiae bacterium]|nr:hypothetical protein [Chlamydiota bacterium]
MPNNFRVTVVSLPDRESLVAEIYYDAVQWVEISQERGELVIQFYHHPLKDYWEFSFEEAMKILHEAKQELQKIG